MEIPSGAWRLTVFQWPSTLLANQVLPFFQRISRRKINLITRACLVLHICFSSSIFGFSPFEKRESLPYNKEKRAIHQALHHPDLSDVQYHSRFTIMGDFVQILLALGHVRNHGGDDKAVWKLICKNEYRRCAVVECYGMMKHVVRKILRPDSDELQIFLGIFEEIDASILQGRFTTSFRLWELHNIHGRVLNLITILLNRPTHKDLQKASVLFRCIQNGLLRRSS